MFPSGRTTASSLAALILVTDALRARAADYGVFSVTVPKDFGTKRLTYTISVNNQPQTITLGLPNGYQIEPYFRNDTGNTPPVVKLDPKGPELKGPRADPRNS